MLQHFCSSGSWNEAHAGVVGEYDITGGDSNTADFDLTVDLDGFDAPFAGSGCNLTGPNRIPDPARMADIPDPTEYDRARFALAKRLSTFTTMRRCSIGSLRHP